MTLSFFMPCACWHSWGQTWLSSIIFLLSQWFITRTSPSILEGIDISRYGTITASFKSSSQQLCWINNYSEYSVPQFSHFPLRYVMADIFLNISQQEVSPLLRPPKFFFGQTSEIWSAGSVTHTQCCTVHESTTHGDNLFPDIDTYT